MSRDALHVVVVGSGPAGAAMVEALRAQSPDAALTLVTAEAGATRPEPGWLDPPDMPVPPSAIELASRHGAALRAGRQAEAIDAADRVLLTTGGPIAYDRLVLALGAAPVRPPIEGDAAGRAVRAARLPRDWARQAGLAPGARIVVLGGDPVGCAAAARLAGDGYRPVLLDQGAQPLSGRVPPAAGSAVREALEAGGVDWRGGRHIVAMRRDGARTDMLLDDGTGLSAEAVLLATGTEPRDALGEAAGLSTQNGIRVDAHGRSSDPHVFAIGSCAAYPTDLGPPARPHISAAMATASSLLGTPCAIRFPQRALRFMIDQHPVELLLPPPGIEGHWTMDEGGSADRAFLFRVRGETLGYVLTGARCLKEAHP